MTGGALPEFTGNRTLAISIAPGRALPPGADRILSAFAVIRENGIVLASEQRGCMALGGDRGVALGSRLVLSPARAKALDAKAVLETLPDRLELGAPATAIVREGPVLAAWCDRYGIGQLYMFESDGLAAVSTSSTLLAELFSRPPDRTALVGFALTGNFIGDASGFVAIRKLPLGKRVVLEGGRCRFEQAASPLDYRDKPESTLEEVTEAFVAAVRRMHKAFPDAELELSGGLDSRLILAALPPEARRGKRAMTIGPAGSGDARVAAILAEREGLEHRLVSSDGFSRLDADGIEALLARIAIGYDHLANPLDKLAIVSAGLAAGPEPKARFGGQNGEILRGFYYTAQPIEQRPGEDLARRLVTWRLEANDRVSDELLDLANCREAITAAREECVSMMLSGGEAHWWQALDRLYLTQRMPRWVGAGSANRFIGRTSLYPFLDPEFVDASMRLPGSLKRGSQAAYRMLSRIDPALALLPLDNGIVPGKAGNHTFGYLTNTVNLVTKSISKVMTKVLGRSKPVLGSASALEQWYGLSLSTRLAVKSLNDTGLVSEKAVESMTIGNRRFDRASLGWLLLVESLVGVKNAVSGMER